MLCKTERKNILGLKKPGSYLETDQLAIYKHDRGVELWSLTAKQLQLSDQSGTLQALSMLRLVYM